MDDVLSFLILIFSVQGIKPKTTNTQKTNWSITKPHPKLGDSFKEYYDQLEKTIHDWIRSQRLHINGYPTLDAKFLIKFWCPYGA